FPVSLRPHAGAQADGSPERLHARLSQPVIGFDLVHVLFVEHCCLPTHAPLTFRSASLACSIACSIRGRSMLGVAAIIRPNSIHASSFACMAASRFSCTVFGSGSPRLWSP